MKKSHPYSGPALLHVGYPKTATSFLQSEVFSNPRFNMSLPAGRSNRANLIHWLRTGYYWDFPQQDVKSEMETLEHPIRAQGLIPVWSDETLLGDPIANIYDGPTILDRLVRLEKAFKVLITVRKQQDICLSLYREFLKKNRHGIQDFVGDGNNYKSFRPIPRRMTCCSPFPASCSLP